MPISKGRCKLRLEGDEKPEKFLYTSATTLIISNICRLQCTNSVLSEKMEASKCTWI